MADVEASIIEAGGSVKIFSNSVNEATSSEEEAAARQIQAFRSVEEQLEILEAAHTEAYNAAHQKHNASY